MNIKLAGETEVAILSQYEKHIRKEELKSSVLAGRVLIAEHKEKLVGWLRWNLFWDNTPFLNMLYVLEGYRNRGYGKKMVLSWEKRMEEDGYQLAMTSTLSCETAQHFYRKLNYVDSGALLLPGEALEIIFTKEFPGS